MRRELCNKLNLLSSRELRNYFIRLNVLLNDRYSSFVYGGINDKEYSNPSNEKVEIVEEKVYEEMFEKIKEKKN